MPSDAAVYHGADVWHGLAGAVDGSGVRVGVIDKGFDGLWDILHTAGTPTPPEANCTFGVGSHLCEPGDAGDPEAHGAWVAEALLDIAPGVELYIARVSETESFIDAAEYLKTQNVDVINASLGALFDTGDPGVPQHADSVLAAVATATADGIAWVNSAGNYGDKERSFFLMLPRGGGLAQADYWHNDWLRMRDDGIFFNKAVIGEDATIGDFRMRWGDATAANPARPNLFVCDNNGCTGNRQIGRGLAERTTVKVGKWNSVAGSATPVYLRVCRDPGGGYPSWVQIGASTHTKFTTAHDKFRTINGIAESRSLGMLAVGAAAATPRSSGPTFQLEDFSSRGPTADGRVKPDIIGVDREPSTILATQVAEGTYSPSSYPDGRWPGTSQAAPLVPTVVGSAPARRRRARRREGGRPT